MRLWLRDSERRPDPAPARTDDRKAIVAGLALWIVGLLVLLVVSGGNLTAEDGVPRLATVAVGLALGLLGLVYLAVKRR